MKRIFRKFLKRWIVNVEIRKERTNMELIDEVLNGNNIAEATKKVLSNERLEQRGFIFPEKHYKQVHI